MTSRKKSRTWINCEDGSKGVDEELLVFGYSCKVFRDEEKAVYIDEGKHLIPWMGDKSLLIDRYDGRGYLHNLREYEPPEEKDAAEDPSEEDQHLQQLLDEERYMALQKSLTEEELYHEEELKRLRAALIDEGAYNQVGFSYEEQQQMAVNGQKEADTEADIGDQMDADGETFVPHAELNVPEGMEVPPTAKVNAIIEKTAMFVSRQGPQMEIVIKAKQSSNAQFSFLAFDHPMNPYYKHMVQAMKTGKYVPRPQADASDDEDGDGYDDHYLHPSLLASQPPQVLNVPKLSYASTGKDRYSLLVSQLKDKVFSGLQEAALDAGRTAGNSTPPPPLAKPFASVEPSPPPPPPGIAPVTLPQGTLDNADASFPPADLLPIVDKMASYVAKNGVDFEAIVKSKGADDRFEFLKPGHRFHTYYQFKRKTYEKQLQIEKENLLKEAAAAEEKEAKLADKVVSFSIKMKEPGEKRNALVLVENEEGQNGVSKSAEEGESAAGSEANAQPEREETAASATAAAVSTESVGKVRVQSQEAKLAEERIRDRLAAAARERLVQVSREKQLQMERKRKAALFLTMLHKGKEEDANLIGPRLPNAAELEILVDAEADLPLIPSFMNAPMAAAAFAPSLFQPQALLQPFAALSPMLLDPVTAAIQDKTVDALIRSHVSNSMKSASAPPVKTAVAAAASHHHHHHHHRRRSKGRGGRDRRGSTRSRSRSRSKSKHKSSSGGGRRRSRSRSKSKSRDRDRKNHKKSRRSRSRSRSKERKRRRRHSSKERDEKAAADKRKSSRTPPAAYSSPRKSDSPRRGKSDRGGKSGSTNQRDRRSRSRSASGRRSRDDKDKGKGGRDSSSSPPPPSTTNKKKDSGRASSSSKQPSSSRTKASRSRSRSRRPSRSPRRSRSPSRTRDSKRSR